MSGFRAWLRRLAADRSGGVAIMLALSIVPLSIAALGAVDLERALSTKTQLQDALDAATLAGAREPTDEIAKIRDAGSMSFRENLINAPLTVTAGPTFNLSKDGQTVVGDASASVDTILAKLVLGGKDIVVNTHSEVRRAGANLEVALVLDITGSMDDWTVFQGRRTKKIDALKSSAADLVDIVVSDHQSPYFSKIALVPYAAAVNVGDKAKSLRGSLKSGSSQTPGWKTLSFQNKNNFWVSHDATTCVTERTGTHAYDDASYKVAKLGFNYPAANASLVKCPGQQIVPMTSNKSTLKSKIDSFVADGSTAGQIGIAWGWYMVSPNFAKLWSGEGKPKAYGTKDLVKVVILMTDGEFNTAYYNGVLSQDSEIARSYPNEAIKHDATNGLSKPQALELCKNMQAAGIEIYTVGFQVTQSDAATIMKTCASDPAHAYLPEDGDELQSAFSSIGHDIAKLHISR